MRKLVRVGGGGALAFVLASGFVSGFASNLALGQPTSNPLAGPTVVVSTENKSLVERDAEGKLVRLDTRPENAALGMLGLKPDQVAPARQILIDRAAAVSELLDKHQALFLKLQAARQGGASPKEIAPLLLEFRPIAAPHVDPPLATRVAAALPEGSRATFNTLVDEYLLAVAGEQRERAGPDNGAGDKKQMPGEEMMTSDGEVRRPGAARPDRKQQMNRRERARVETTLLLNEMARTVGEIVSERREHSEELYKIVEATDEQRSKIAGITRDPAFGDGLNRTDEQRLAMRRKIMDVHTPEQRRKLIAARLNDGAGPR